MAEVGADADPRCATWIVVAGEAATVVIGRASVAVGVDAHIELLGAQRAAQCGFDLVAQTRLPVPVPIRVAGGLSADRADRPTSDAGSADRLDPHRQDRFRRRPRLAGV